VGSAAMRWCVGDHVEVSQCGRCGRCGWDVTTAACLRRCMDWGLGMGIGNVGCVELRGRRLGFA
jgi:hypothetical protein